MAKKIAENIKTLLTHKRTFVKNGRLIEKPFIPVLQNVGDQEVLFIHEIVKKKYGATFTIDLIKLYEEEAFIHFRGTFNIEEPQNYQGKGTIYLDSDTYEILWDNLERLLERKVESRISKLLPQE